MPLATLLLPLLAQIGPGGALPQAPLPDRRDKAAASPPSARPGSPTDAIVTCMQAAIANPADGIDEADGWLARAKTGKERAGAEQCKGLALARQERFAEAARQFAAARDDTPANETGERARLGELAANAFLAASDFTAALAVLDRARADAKAAAAHDLIGQIEIDRATALVALHRNSEASAALDAARSEVPDNAQAWLLSATLSRRQGKLADAQQQIERAAVLMPVDPEIGLEAGVIAVLSGRDEAARKSWRSVIKAAPDSSFAKTAQGYLDQLGSPSASPVK